MRQFSHHRFIYTFSQDLVICAGTSILIGDTEYTETGTYVDTLVSATMCDSIVTTNLEVLPAIDVTVVADAITLTGGDIATDPTSFQWIKCDPFEVIDGANSREYIVEENGDYAVIIAIDDCVDTSDCITISEVGIKHFDNNFATIYPNPNQGQFTIKIDNNNITGLILNVMNFLGASIYSENIIKALMKLT